MKECEQCGDKVEPKMIIHAKKYKQPFLCEGCDEYFSRLNNSKGRDTI